MALSSTEVEYRRAIVATYQAIWLSRLLQDLQIKVLTPILIYYENISSVWLAKNLVFHARTKHIEVLYHFLPEWVLSNEVKLLYVRTDWQVADILTKALGSDKLQHFSEMLGIQHLHVPHLRGRTGTDNVPRKQPEKRKIRKGRTT